MKGKIAVLLILVFASSCVMQKKYDELLAEKLKLESKLNECDDKLATSKLANDSLRIMAANLLEDTTKLGNDIRTTQQELGTLKAEHEQLNTHYNNLINNSGKLTKDLAEQQKSLMAIRENLEKTRQLNEQLNSDLKLREAKVQELENILQKEKDKANTLKNKISEALLNFKDSDLTVEMKDGKIYVSLAEKLLFKSGSIVVDAKGVKALQQLAEALKSQENIEVVVEGHTDNVPIANTQKYFQDNWDLSVLRATSIARILTNAGIEPQMVSAAGKGEFVPVAENNSSENRQKNRRTEIIITPDLSKLFNILNTN